MVDFLYNLAFVIVLALGIIAATKPGEPNDLP